MEQIPLEEVHKRLSRDESFTVDTVARVISVVKKYACGDRWTLGSLDVGSPSREADVKMRLNLWDRFSLIAADLEPDDVLFVKNALAKNYEYEGQRYPQLNCSERLESEVEVKYKRERILVDGSNVAMSVQNRASIACIELVRTKLLSLGYAPIVIADANLRHLLSEEEKRRFESMLNDGTVIQSPAGVRADDAFLKLSDERGYRIVSNDLFRQYRSIYPWIDKRRIGFTIAESNVVFHGL